MNRCLLFFWSALLMIITGCSSGGGEDIPTPTPTPENDVVTIPTREFSANPEGGNVVVSFTTNKAWTASSNANWCVLSASNGEKGAQSLTLKVAANEDKKDRSAIVTLKAGSASGTVTVTQKAPTAKLEVTQKEFNASSKGEDLKISFVTDAAWTASSDQEWCVLSATEGEEGDKEVTVTVKANETGEARVAKVTIQAGSTSATVTILQDSNPFINADSDDYKVSFIGGLVEIEVVHNVDFEITQDASWIKWVDSEQQAGKRILLFEVEENQNEEERKTTITFVNKALELKTSVTVTQAGMPEDNSIQPGGNVGNMTWG